jgi:hypothetical protein
MSFFGEVGGKLLDGFEQFYRLIGPPLLAAVFLFGGLGYFVLDMYKFNVVNKVKGSFPTQFIIGFYFYFMVAAIMFILLILVFQTMLLRKHRGTRTNATITHPPTSP